MDQHRDALATKERREANLDWQADRNQLQESIDTLHKTMHRLYTMQPEYLELIECAQLNIQDATALEKDLNSVSIQLGLLPLSRRTTQWAAIQLRMSFTHKLGCIG